MRTPLVIVSFLLPLALSACDQMGGYTPPPPPEPMGSSTSAPSSTAPATTAPAAAAPAPAPAPSPAAAVATPEIATDPDLSARVEDLEMQLAELRLALEEMRAAGIGTVLAENVSYQPHRTTMDARSAQDAVDELWDHVNRLEGGLERPGPAGEGLFDLENGPLGPRSFGEESKGGEDHPPKNGKY